MAKTGSKPPPVGRSVADFFHNPDFQQAVVDVFTGRTRRIELGNGSIAGARVRVVVYSMGAAGPCRIDIKKEA